MKRWLVRMPPRRRRGRQGFMLGIDRPRHIDRVIDYFGERLVPVTVSPARAAGGCEHACFVVEIAGPVSERHGGGSRRGCGEGIRLRALTRDVSGKPMATLTPDPRHGSGHAGRPWEGRTHHAGVRPGKP